MKNKSILPQDSDLALKAMRFAKDVHEKVQQKYDDQPYFYGHLTPVVDVAIEFILLVPNEYRESVIAACWLHDTLEDCGAHVNYNTLKENFGRFTAELVFAVTNPKGRNRKERECDEYYSGIKDTMLATFVKLCDRIANARYGLKTESSMWKWYSNECNNFCYKLYDPELHSMFSELRTSLGKN